MEGLVALLTEDVLMTMPPIPQEYLGRELVARFLRVAIFRPGIACLPVPTRERPALQKDHRFAYGQFFGELPDGYHSVKW